MKLSRFIQAIDLHAKGEFAINEDFVHEGILGTVFTVGDIWGGELERPI